MALTQIKAAALTADLIDETKLADNSIDSEHYNDGSIDTAHIADSQVTTAKIAADAVTAAKLADNAVVTASILDGEITTAKLADDVVTAAKLASDAVVTASILDGEITTAKIGDDQITNAKIAAGAVGGTQLGSNAVSEAKIGANEVTSGKIAAGAIGTAKISDGAVTAAKLASGVGGKILQVISTVKSDTFSTSSSSWTLATGMSVAITPSSSSNKILVILDAKIGAGHEDAAFAGRLLRDKGGSDVSAIFYGNAASNRTQASFGTSRQSGNAGYDVLQDRQAIFLDSPNTTSQVSYKLQVVCNNSRDVYVNRTHDDSDDDDTPRTASSITVLEVSA